MPSKKKKGKAAAAAEPTEEEEDAGEEGELDIAALAADMASAVDVTDEAPAKPAAAPTPKEDEGEGDGPTLRASTVVTGKGETRYIPHIPYCEVSSLPFEYCEFSPLIKKCRENFEKTYKTHYPDVEGEEGLAELMAQLGMTGGDAASKKAQSGKKPADPNAPAGSSGKKKEQAPAQIVIELNNRNKKKHITTVKGLELYGVDTAAAAKLFGKRFACGSSLKKSENGQPPQIEIQGSCHLDLPAIIVDKLKMSLDDIYIVIDGKKVKAADAPAPIKKGV